MVHGLRMHRWMRRPAWNHQHLEDIFTYPKDEIITGKRLQKTMERSTHLEIGTSTISTGPFSMSQSVTNYQRVIHWDGFSEHEQPGFPPDPFGKIPWFPVGNPAAEVDASSSKPFMARSIVRQLDARGSHSKLGLASGNFLHSYWKWLINNWCTYSTYVQMVIFHSYVSLPEANSSFAMVVSEHGVYRNKTTIFEHDVQPVDCGVAYFPTAHIAQFTYIHVT